MGGENYVDVVPSMKGFGSSPRGRGKQEVMWAEEDYQRLIPAWAGKTFLSPQTSFFTAAHPRVGGENRGREPGNVVGAGSSPRGRGKLTRPTSGPLWYAAHPRVGGENATRTRRRSR